MVTVWKTISRETQKSEHTRCVELCLLLLLLYWLYIQMPYLCSSSMFKTSLNCFDSEFTSNKIASVDR